jgi:hypothetical protein
MPDIEDASPPSEPAGGLDAMLEKAMVNYGEEGEQAAETPEATDTETRRGNPYRDEPTGRFTNKPEDAAETSVTEPIEAASTPDVETKPEPAPVQPLEPHPRWSDADKAAFAQLPPDGQKFVTESYKRMEADYTRKTQDIAETKRAVEPFVEKLTKWSPYFQQLGVAPSQAFDNLLQHEYTLRHGTPEQKRQLIDALESDYQVPPRQAANAGYQEQAQQGQVDPVWQDPIIPQVQTLSQQLQQTQAEIQQLRTQAEQHKQQEQRFAAQAEFERIGLTKNADGSPVFPHFDVVKKDMIDLVSEGKAENWEIAYNKAVRLNDDLYNQNIAERERNALAAEEKRRKEAVEKAKHAAPVRTSHGVSGGTKPKGLDAHLNSAFSKFGG